MSEEKKTPEVDTSIEVTWGDGSKVKYTTDQLGQIFMAESRVMECVVSVEEGRQRRDYEGAKRFISSKVNFERNWGIIDAIQDNAMKATARRLLGQIMTSKVMQVENWLFSMIAHANAKDRLPVYWRDPNNPFVEHGWDLQAALTVASQKPQGAQGTNFRGGKLQ